MPFCPECREEFDSGIAVCVDCGDVELVSSLEGIAPRPEVLPGHEHIEGEARFMAEDRALAEGFVSHLTGGGIPAYLYEEPFKIEERSVYGFAVPSDFVDATHARLRTFPFEEAETADRVVRIYARPDTSDDGEAPSLFESNDEEIIARGGAVHSDLAEILLSDDPLHRARATGLLARMGEEGQTLLVAILDEGIEAGKREFVSGFLLLLEPFKLRPSEDRLRGHIESSDVDRRALGIRTAGRLWGIDATKLLVPCLSDEVVDVRDEAIEMLFHLHGIDFGYDAEADEAEREAAIAKWRKRVATG